MAEPFTIYKLTILYMLDKSSMPLTNTQITNFFLERDYTDYFRIQEVIGNLVEAGLIIEEPSHRTTQYQLTAAGQETLGFFQAKITEGIEQDVCEYFAQNSWEFKRENSVVADYRRTKDYLYEVTCQIRQDGITIVDLKLSVKNREQAEAICRNWKERNEDCYMYLLDNLLT